MVDRYTKWVLTVIAAALVIMVVQNVIRPSVAQSYPEIQKVQICEDARNCAHLGAKREVTSFGVAFARLTVPVSIEADNRN